ncbi:hypothetical protein FJZ19_06060 [Candidatus Pacearchaeota archaeon]|nr:hypothetical protein [Candidatus Pacearchaeota archaeon]
MIYDKTTLDNIERYAQEHVRREFEGIAAFFGSKATRPGNLRIQSAHVPGGNPLTCAFTMRCVYSGDTEQERGETELFVKYCADRPSHLPAGFLEVPRKYWHVEQETYKFCDFSYMPTYYPNAPRSRFIVQRRIDGETLDKLMEETFEESDRAEIAKNVLEALAKLHVDLRLRMMQLRDERMRGVPEGERFRRLTRHLYHDKTNTTEKALGYIRAIKGLRNVEELPDEVKRTIRRHYWVIDKSYEPLFLEDQVSHGNPTTSNIMVDGERRIVILDPNIKFRRHAVDAAEFISSPGMKLNLDVWKRACDYYWDLFDANCGREPRHRVKFVNGALNVLGIANGMTTRTEGEEKQRERDWFNYCFHESLKKSGKSRDIKTYFPWLWDEWLNCRFGIRGVHKEMLQNVAGATAAITSDSKKYELDERALEGYDELKKLLIDKGWMIPENLSEKQTRVVMPGTPTE